MKQTIDLRDDKLEVRFPFDQTIIRAVKDVDPRGKWQPDTKAWVFPAEELVARRLIDLFGLPEEYLPDGVRGLLPAIKTQEHEIDTSILENFSFRTNPYEHQRKGLATLIKHPRWLLAWEMGSGKTFVVANRLRWGIESKEFIGPILILCPKSVMSVWPGELWKHAGLDCTVLEGSTKDKAAILMADRKIFVTNYESLIYLRQELSEKNFDVIVYDEIQRVKAGTSKTARNGRIVSKSARYRWGLSGTPAPNGLVDWFGVLSALDTKILGTESKIAFENQYCVKKELDAGIRIIVGYKNTQDLMKRVRSVSSRVTKAECLDLPPKTFVERRCVMTDTQARVYRELKNKAVANLKTAEAEGILTVRNVLTESLRLLQCAGGWVADDIGQEHPLTPNAKMGLLEEIIEEVGEKQLVIWCNFVAELHAVAKRLADEGEVVTFYGGTTDAERKTALARFKANDARYFVGTAQSGGVGINELVVADTMIFYSRGFRWDLYEQAVARIDRNGQLRPMTIINLIAEGTVDLKVKEAIERKGDLQELIIGKKPEDIFG